MLLTRSFWGQNVLLNYIQNYVLLIFQKPDFCVKVQLKVQTYNNYVIFLE